MFTPGNISLKSNIFKKKYVEKYCNLSTYNTINTCIYGQTDIQHTLFEFMCLHPFMYIYKSLYWTQHADRQTSTIVVVVLTEVYSRYVILSQFPQCVFLSGSHCGVMWCPCCPLLNSVCGPPPLCVCECLFLYVIWKSSDQGKSLTIIHYLL